MVGLTSGPLASLFVGHAAHGGADPAAALLDRLDIETRPAQPPVADPADDDAGHLEPRPVGMRPPPAPLAPLHIVGRRGAHDLRVEVRHAREHRRPVLAHLRVARERPVRMRRLLTVVALFEAVHEGVDVMGVHRRLQPLGDEPAHTPPSANFSARFATRTAPAQRALTCGYSVLSSPCGPCWRHGGATVPPPPPLGNTNLVMLSISVWGSVNALPGSIGVGIGAGAGGSGMPGIDGRRPPSGGAVGGSGAEEIVGSGRKQWRVSKESRPAASLSNPRGSMYGFVRLLPSRRG